MTSTAITVGGAEIVVHRANTVIVGAGAAGMRCAVQLVRSLRACGVAEPQGRLLVVTGGLALGASRMSGSDKQTYYKMGTSPRVPDTAEDFAGTLTAFGCCHGDTALVEGICSLRGFYGLVEAGVPFPHEPSGAFIGYKTDHDPCERATSAGPKTSRFMSECLQAEAQRMGVRIIDKHPVVGFLTSGAGDDGRIVAMACIDRARASGDCVPLAAFVAENWVLAAGGPGEVYATTVYPRGQVGIHGPAFLAGLEACNLTESQYGLASVKFRWNVSGTYMQVVPRIFSTDADGRDEREFLTEYFGDMPAMATNIFLKGYQWPFDAQRIAGRQSSLIDMAVHQETVVRGRRVWMDFLRDPIGADGWAEFDVNALGEEALAYLRKTGATQQRPIDRLGH
ncbi:MAG: FAD-binding protein, partial [Phycisphaerae bacterium]